MVGQGSPIAWKIFHRFAIRQIGLGLSRLIFCIALLLSSLGSAASDGFAAEKTVRLRLAWGSGSSAKQRWTGTISIEDGTLSQLQPLGIEADAPVAQRIEGNRLIVAPLEKRGFDGCDLTVRADEQALVKVELRNEQSPQAARFEATLAEIVAAPLQQPIDELGSYFLARRSPGDRLRVISTREHYVFGPGETWQLKIQPDLTTELAAGPVLVDVQLRATGEEKPIWRSTEQIRDSAQATAGIEFEIECPATEGAYRLTVTARPQEGFATRFVPGQQAKPIATRDVDFVVIDPAAKLPALTDNWLPVLTIDPANPSWWQRLPAWAQVPRLRITSGSLGNVRPVVRPTPTGQLMELPPPPTQGDPYWQAYTLPVREPGQPHLVEIEYPLGVEQHLAISLVEPDAAGRVTATQQDASLFGEEHNNAANGEIGIHRFVVWPRTRSPQLLIVNRHPTAPGQYGKINLRKQETTAALSAVPLNNGNSRLVAGYLSKPLLAQNFGAAEVLDANSGLSVQGWSTFLQATQRLAQSLRLGGYNAVMLSVAADGGGLYPSGVINPSPRYDTGTLAASGQDPLRKDVLEMLLRVFDREGIRVIPTIQLATPLPQLESLQQNSDARESGLSCVDYNGQTWRAINSTSDGLAPFYNPLNQQVQAEFGKLVNEITTRYRHHSSFAGIGIQVSGRSHSMLPGLAWGFDDSTVAAFTRATGIQVPAQGADRFRQRANFLLGEQRQAWQKWRIEQLSQLYARLASQMVSQRSDLLLLLSTEDLFAGHELQQRVRQSIVEPVAFDQILREHGLDLELLDSLEPVIALTPHQSGATDDLQKRALELRVNLAAEQGELLSADQRSAELFYHPTKRFRLPSFDERSPFGQESTFLTVTSQPRTVGFSKRRQLLTSLAADDTLTVVAGGLQPVFDVDAQQRGLLQTLQQLPSRVAETLTQRQQPVVVRIHRTDRATMVTMINEAPWPVEAAISLAGSRPCQWQKLGNEDSVAQSGMLSMEKQPWQVELQPYDLQAWSFADEKLRVSELKVSLTELAKQDLQQRIQDIESRVGNLSIERPYDQLQNPDFELQDGTTRIVGWQPLPSPTGTVALDTTAPHAGVHSLRLTSTDTAGVAVQSHLFPTPDTGQLMISFQLRCDQFADESQLQIALQDPEDGRHYRQLAILGKQQIVSDDWSRYQFALTDVPTGQVEQLRLRFHLLGNAQASIDQIQLYDLRFDDARRRALVKRIYAAKIALEQGKVVDCLRVVDDYWSRYLVEYVPPTGTTETLAAKPTPAAPPQAEPEQSEKEKGFGTKLRGWVPKIWR